MNDETTAGAEDVTDPTIEGPAVAADSGALPWWATPPPADEPPTEPVPPAWPAAAVVAPTGPSPAPNRRWLGTAAVAVVSALIGGGVVAAVDRVGDDDGATVRSVSGGGRNTSVITRESNVQAILAKVEPGVVSIQTEQFQQGLFGEIRQVPGAGTGMILTADGNVLTNAHVVRGAQRIEVTLSGEKRARDAELVGMDASADVAMIKIRDASGLPTVELGNSKDLVVGDDVIAIGNALALEGGLSVTQGIVSALNRTLEDGAVHFENLIQTDAAINGGNSGGPLVNAGGQVVGINTVVIQQSGGNLVQNVGFAIAIDSVKPLIEQLRKGEAAAKRTAFLGVTTQTVNAEVVRQLELPVEEGAILITVGEGSPAENAGLERFDVIVRIGDAKVRSAEDVTSEVAKHDPGDEVEVEFVRGRRTRTTTVTLGSRLQRPPVG